MQSPKGLFLNGSQAAHTVSDAHRLHRGPVHIPPGQLVGNGGEDILGGLRGSGSALQLLFAAHQLDEFTSHRGGPHLVEKIRGFAHAWVGGQTGAGVAAPALDANEQIGGGTFPAGNLAGISNQLLQLLTACFNRLFCPAGFHTGQGLHGLLAPVGGINEVVGHNASAAHGEHKDGSDVGVGADSGHLIKGFLVAAQHTGIVVGQHHNIGVSLGDPLGDAITALVQGHNQNLVSDAQPSVRTEISIEFHCYCPSCSEICIMEMMS